MRKIFITACEASGDLHGAHLIKEIKNIDPSISFSGLGGKQMEEAGLKLIYDMTKISALGFGDVIKNYGLYKKIFDQTIRNIEKENPDAVILIDSPAFNIRLAKKISKKVKVIYYISPQIWAWGRRRIHTIKKHVHKMLVILPFEKELYEKAGVPSEFVGHPLLDNIPPTADTKTLKKELGISTNEKAIGLFAGSREKEVKRIFPVMLKSASIIKKIVPNTKFFMTRSSNVRSDLYDEILKKFPIEIKTPDHHFYDIAKAMDFALVTSGTATLETALLGTPFFLLYKTGWATYLLGRCLIRVPFLGLVNLLAKKEVVPEFIQHDAHPETIAHEAKVLLENSEPNQRMKEEFLEVRKILGSAGASKKAAKEVLKFI